MDKKKFTELLKQYYSMPMIKKLRTNRVRPSYKMMIMLLEKHGIPVEAWRDIREYLK